jgi:cytochrome c oxidase cbb3-type subunit 1
MDKYVILFIKTSLVSLITGSALGIDMAMFPYHALYFVNAHTHLNLLGFMAMMIYGVGYHVLPRFSGMLIHSRTLMVAHYYLGTVTLALMAVFWTAMEMTPYVGAMRAGIAVSGIGHVVSILFFVYNIFRSIKPVAFPVPGPQKT